MALPNAEGGGRPRGGRRPGSDHNRGRRDNRGSSGGGKGRQTDEVSDM